MIHVYYGDGKGKTTAALGLVTRAAGSGMTCVVAQFLKDWKVGELISLEALGVRVLRGKAEGHAFSFEMTDEEKRETRRIHDEILNDTFNFAPGAGLIVLDEAIDAIGFGLLDADALAAYLDEWRDKIEIVVTGHKADAAILSRADYVTEMVKRAHPYDRGILARKGVEF